jgi:hypothetical protein
MPREQTANKAKIALLRADIAKEEDDAAKKRKQIELSQMLLIQERLEHHREALSGMGGKVEEDEAPPEAPAYDVNVTVVAFVQDLLGLLPTTGKAEHLFAESVRSPLNEFINIQSRINMETTNQRGVSIHQLRSYQKSAAKNALWVALRRIV